MELKVDYVSDIHLTHYVKYDADISVINKFIMKNIGNQSKGEILVIAGDIDENLDRVNAVLNCCLDYYEKVIFVSGNHEYYIPHIKFLYMDEKAKEYEYNSINKIIRLNELYGDNENIIFLDRNSYNNGIFKYKDFLIAGDTLWYLPRSFLDWHYYYPNSNDSRFIMSDLNKREKITNMHNESMQWYESLPNNLDLMISHVPPIKNKNNKRGNNCCYFNEVKDIKSSNWIYGHDHKSNEVIINDTKFVTNPWGYECKDFKIKTLTLKK